MTATLHDSTMLENNNDVRMLDGRQAMRDDDHCALRSQRFQRLLDRMLSFSIQRGSCLDDHEVSHVQIEMITEPRRGRLCASSSTDIERSRLAASHLTNHISNTCVRHDMRRTSA